MVKVLILKKRKDFVRAAKGFKMVAPSLILQAAQSLPGAYRKLSDDSCFLGFTATKKLGKAFVRNRTKRRLRAASREIFPKHALSGIDYVLIGRYNTKDIDFKQLKDDMKHALKRLNKQISQNIDNKGNSPQDNDTQNTHSAN